MGITDARSDANLLKASGRHADAFGVFYERHARAVSNYFTYRTADPSLAADLTAETFAEAFASRRRYRDTGDPAAAWLFTIAARQLNEFFRQERVSSKYRERLGLSQVFVADEFDRVEDLDELRRRLPALNDALGCLTEASAEAVTLRVGHEWSYTRLAEHLGCSPASARVRISRALHDLENHLSSPQVPGDTA